MINFEICNSRLLLSFLNAIIFFIIAGFHYYWTFGGRYGLLAAVPEIESTGRQVFMPGRLITFVVANLFLIVAVYFFCIGLQSDLISARHAFYFLTGISFITFLRAIGDFKYVGFFKKKSNTLFSRNDTSFYSPLCLFLALTSFIMIWI